MNDKLQEVAELRANMEGLPVRSNSVVVMCCPLLLPPSPHRRVFQAEVISGASTLLRTTEPAMEVKDGSLQRRELILFTDQYVAAAALSFHRS